VLTLKVLRHKRIAVGWKIPLSIQKLFFDARGPYVAEGGRDKPAGSDAGPALAWTRPPRDPAFPLGGLVAQAGTGDV